MFVILVGVYSEIVGGQARLEVRRAAISDASVGIRLLLGGPPTSLDNQRAGKASTVEELRVCGLDATSNLVGK